MSINTTFNFLGDLLSFCGAPEDQLGYQVSTFRLPPLAARSFRQLNFLHNINIFRSHLLFISMSVEEGEDRKNARDEITSLICLATLTSRTPKKRVSR